MFNAKRLTIFGLLAVLMSVFVPLGAAQDSPSGEITVWIQRANQEQIEETVLEDFYAAYPDITVEFVNYAPDEVANQLALAIQGGVGAPDVALTEHNQIPRLIDLGGLAPMTEQIQPYLGDVVPGVMELMQEDGEYYALPWDVGPVVTFYRRDIFEAAGLSSDPLDVQEMIGTWDAFATTCETIKEEVGVPCFAMNKANNYGDMWANIIWSTGGGWFEDGKVTVNSETGVAAMEQLGVFWENDLVSDELEWTDGWYAQLNASLGDENVQPIATVTIGAWMGGFLKNWAAADQSGNWGVVLMPAFEDGVRSSNQGGSSYIIPEDSDNQEAAWAFIEFVTSEEAQLAIFEYGDIFPALTSTYESEMFAEGDEYFAGQAVREVYAEAGELLPSANIYGVYYPAMNSATDTALQTFATGNANAQEALDQAASVIRSETGLE